jgi:hypothetical protein
VSDRIPLLRDIARALGSPIYGVPGSTPAPSYGSHGPATQPRALGLAFGPQGKKLLVETSVEPLRDRKLVVDLLFNADPAYPLTIEERAVSISIDGREVDFRVLWINDRSWSDVAKIADRWVYLRGIGIAIDDVVIGSIL